jgi:hypothetical protein
MKFKLIIKAWLITACITAAVNLTWFYCNTAIIGNPWSDVIGLVPILVMSFASILVGSMVYWLISFFLAKADLSFAIGAIIVTAISVAGHPKLSNGAIVPPEFRVIDIPMHFVAGLLCAFCVPAICRGRYLKLLQRTQKAYLL